MWMAATMMQQMKAKLLTPRRKGTLAEGGNQPERRPKDGYARSNTWRREMELWTDAYAMAAVIYSCPTGNGSRVFGSKAMKPPWYGGGDQNKKAAADWNRLCIRRGA